MENKLAHQIKSRSMVRVRCGCGWFFHNETLRGKKNEEIQYETDAAFERHLKDMELAGF
jgi:hypothetical protein